MNTGVHKTTCLKKKIKIKWKTDESTIAAIIQIRIEANGRQKTVGNTSVSGNTRLKSKSLEITFPGLEKYSK